MQDPNSVADALIAFVHIREYVDHGKHLKPVPFLYNVDPLFLAYCLKNDLNAEICTGLNARLALHGWKLLTPSPTNFEPPYYLANLALVNNKAKLTLTREGARIWDKLLTHPQLTRLANIEFWREGR